MTTVSNNPNMQKKKLVEMLREEPKKFNQWRREQPKDPHGLWLDLAEVDLSGADLTGANLGNTNLQKSNLSHTVLIDVNFFGAMLSSVDLTGAIYTPHDMRGARGLHSARLDSGRFADIEAFVESRWKRMAALLAIRTLRTCLSPDIISKLELNISELEAELKW